MNIIIQHRYHSSTIVLNWAYTISLMHVLSCICHVILFANVYYLNGILKGILFFKCTHFLLYLFFFLSSVASKSFYWLYTLYKAWLFLSHWWRKQTLNWIELMYCVIQTSLMHRAEAVFIIALWPDEEGRYACRLPSPRPQPSQLHVSWW